MPNNAGNDQTYLTGSEYGRNTPHEVEAQGTRRRQGLLAKDVEPTGVKTIKADYHVEATDRVILVDATPGAVRILLPKTADVYRRTIMVKKIDSSGNAVTIEPNRNALGAELIDGAATLAISTQYAVKNLYAGEGAWWVLADR